VNSTSSDAAARSRRRAELEDIITRAIAQLDAMDWDPDLEPDEDGEEDADEASAQPITLSPDRRPVVVHRPSARQMRAAYRRNGDPIPANLRGFGSVFGSARA
jgi:hypothetical protein